MTSPRYADAGVDLDAADDAKARIGELVAGTRTALSVGANPLAPTDSAKTSDRAA